MECSTYIICGFSLIFILNFISGLPDIHYGICRLENQYEGVLVEESKCKKLKIPAKSGDPMNVKCQDNEKNLICCPKQILLPQPPTCGSAIGDRSSEEAKLGEFPWLALLRYINDSNNEVRFFCGGTLINHKWVLTAAHCITGFYVPYPFRVNGVRLGEHDTTRDADCLFDINGQHECSKYVEYDTDIVIGHSEYFEYNSHTPNDIALLRLLQHVQFSEFIAPLCIFENSKPPIEDSFSFMAMDIVGWSLMQYRNTLTDVKRKVVVRVWHEEQCKNESAVIDDTQICAGDRGTGNFCKGDTGGPLMMIRKDKKLDKPHYFAVGIMSMSSESCRDAEKPIIFTRVNKYIDWIKRELMKDFLED